MSRTHLRRTTAAAALLVALASLTACGGDTTGKAGESSEPSTSESTSSATTSIEPTEADTPSVSTGGEEIDPSEFIDAYTAALEQATTAHIAMEFHGGPLASTIDGDADFSSSPPNMRMTIPDPTTGKKQEFVLVDGSMYIQVAKNKYIKTDLKDSPLGTSTDFLDPTSIIDTLSKGITGATYFGPEDVDGEALEHYNIVVDAKTLIDAFAAGQEGGQDIPSGALPDDLAFDSYFDGDGFLRRTSVDLGDQLGSTTVDYDQWGQSVSIEAPPASQVQQLPGS